MGLFVRKRIVSLAPASLAAGALLLLASPRAAAAASPGGSPASTAPAVSTTPVSAIPSAPPDAAAVPDATKSETPRGAVQRFVDLCRAGEYARASKFLSGDPGPATARRFKLVLDRRLWLDMEAISDKPAGDESDRLPDGIDQIGTIQGPTGTEPVRVVRVGMPADPHWVFARSTVSRVDAWFGALPQAWLLDRIPAPLLRPGPRELAWWQWAALPLVVLLSWLLGKLLGALVDRLLAAAVRRTKSSWDDAILARVGGPIRVALALVVADFVFVPMLGLYPPAEAFLGKLLHVGLYAIFFWASFRVADLVGELALKLPWAKDGAHALVPLAVRAGKVSIISFGVVAILSDLGYPVASLLAGLGIGGLALALAAQKTGENLFGSIAIAVDRPFEQGDWVQLGADTVGTVETIGLRSTKVRTLGRTLVSIPNGKLADMRVETYRVRDRIMLSLTIGLVYETTAAQMREVLAGLEAALRAHPKIWPDNVIVRFASFGDSSLNVDVMAWFQTRDWNEFMAIRQEVLLSFMDVVEKAGSGFAFPTQTVHLESSLPALAEPMKTRASG